jgi:multidrug resistance protein
MAPGKDDQQEGQRTKEERPSTTPTCDGNKNIQAKDAVKSEVESTVESAQDAVIPYTVFTKAERRIITWLIGCSMFFSPFTANIYFPCLEQLQQAMNVSSSLINLTITTFLIIQAIAPAFCGDLADNIGRRPVYLLTFSIYVCANLALALQNNYPVLMVLRGLQSFRCSATVAISYGVVADVATPATRGSMFGPAMVATNLGPSVGPLIGGILAARAGWRWAFWLLFMVGATFIFILAAVLPETARTIVGNGSVAAPKWNKPVLRSRHQREQIAEIKARTWVKRDMIPNPLKALTICFHRDTAAVLSISALYYAAYYCIQASIPEIFTDLYGLNELQVGLCYFSIGSGVILGGFINGKLPLGSSAGDKWGYPDTKQASLWTGITVRSQKRTVSSSTRPAGMILISFPLRRHVLECHRYSYLSQRRLL